MCFECKLNKCWEINVILLIIFMIFIGRCNILKSRSLIWMCVILLNIKREKKNIILLLIDLGVNN